MPKWLVSVETTDREEGKGEQSFVVVADTPKEAVDRAFAESNSATADRHRRGAAVGRCGTTVETIDMTPMGIAYSSSPQAPFAS